MIANGKILLGKNVSRFWRRSDGGNKLAIGITQTNESALLYGGLQQLSTSLSAFSILFSSTAFFGNFLIFVTLHKESSLHPPSKLFYRCLATTDLLVGLLIHPLSANHWMSSLREKWRICRYTFSAWYLTGYILCSVSLMTMTAISVDRLLALLLRLIYRQVVALRRIYIVIATFWIISWVATLSSLFIYTITFWFGCVNTTISLTISMVSHAKIFRGLRSHSAQIPQQPSQTNTLNMARYRKAVYNALWVQLALVVCYLSYGTLVIVLSLKKTNSSNFIFTWGIAPILVSFNLT